MLMNRNRSQAASPCKRVVLHVGLPKTGSTSIQSFLAENADELDRKGYVFPLLQGRGSDIPGYHTDLFRALHRKLHINNSERILETWQSAIDTFVENRIYHTFIISHESLGMTHGPIDYLRLSQMFRGLPVEVVIYLRSAEEWLTSFYEHLVRGAPRLARLPNNFHHMRRYIEVGFEGILKELAFKIPTATFDVIAFDAAKKSPGIVPSFFEAIRAPQMGGAAVRRNTRMSTNQIAVLRALNKMAVDTDIFMETRKFMQQRNLMQLENIGDRVSIFTDDVRKRISDRFEADIVYVNERYGVLLPRDQPLSKGADSPMALTNEKVDAVLAQLVQIPNHYRLIFTSA